MSRWITDKHLLIVLLEELENLKKGVIQPPKGQTRQECIADYEETLKQLKQEEQICQKTF